MTSTQSKPADAHFACVTSDECQIRKVLARLERHEIALQQIAAMAPGNDRTLAYRMASIAKGALNA